MGNIVLADGQTTPANHTFVLESYKNGVYSYVELNANAAVGSRRLTYSLQKGDGAAEYKATVKFWNPVLEVVSDGGTSGYEPPPKVAYYEASSHVFNIPARSSTAVRKDSSAFAANLLDNTVIRTMLNDLIYGPA
jgi:hypothetical protein